MTMQRVNTGYFVAADADAVWAIISDFGNSQLAKGYVDRVELEGEGIGALRIYHLASHLGGGKVIERLEEINHADRSYRYRMIDNGPLNWTGYEGEITVTPSGPGRSAVMFDIRMMPIGASPAEVVDISQANIACYIDNLNAALKA